jgi:hypothetical protein
MLRVISNFIVLYVIASGMPLVVEAVEDVPPVLPQRLVAM